MTGCLQELGPGARVAVIRLRSLGDCVLTTPALRLLKQARPDLVVGVMVEDRFRAVFEGNPDVDEILSPGLLHARAFRPKLCLNLHGGTRSAAYTLLSGARYRAGFGHFAFPWVYNVRIPRAQEILGVDRKVHTAEHVASAMFYLGVPEEEIPRARLSPGEMPRFRPRHSYAILHPVASSPEKTWPAAWYLSVAQHIKRNLDLEPVFIGGPGEDLTPFQVWPCVAGAPLSQIKSLLHGATLFVGNDSGPAHMAAAFGLPVVVLYGPSDEIVWAPWRTAAEVLAARGTIHGITEEQVLRALDRMRVHAA